MNYRYISAALLGAALFGGAQTSQGAQAAAVAPAADQVRLHRHIMAKMPMTVRTIERDTLGKYGLPHPFSVPCVQGGFQDMFYWDTYFTNAGLLVDGDKWQARNNIENVAAMIERLGYMPNATSGDMDDRTQPPFFCMMVKDYFDATADTAFLASMIAPLEKEYNFWMTERVAPNGLNRYGHSATDAELRAFYRAVAPRVGESADGKTDAELVKAGAHLLAEAESGWDFNPRFERRCMDYNPVDLNALLYGYEKNMAQFLKVLGRPGAKEWEKRADSRRKLMRKLMVDAKSKLYYDYDFVNKHRSPVYSAAALTTLWQGVADKGEAAALVRNLGLIEGAHGVYCNAPGERTVKYQWDYPNGWAPVQAYAVKGLDSYGYKADAARIARKYVEAQAGIHSATCQLWEKYNADKGNTEVSNEYAMPGNFLGWTAGAYQTAYNYLYGSEKTTDANRVANIINFIRFTEPRRYEHPSLNWISDTVLYETVESQIDLLNKYKLKSSFLIQYDAMIQPNYQKLLKERPCAGTEIGAWWEITEPHCKDAGIAWRGRYPWDWYANVGFSTGYTPAEREKLVDVYMAKFKEIFGYYPKSVGSWFIDAHSLDYMQKKYGIVASAACRDQIGTDGYNLWGGYWQGGYYPSKKNMYIPAQTAAQQINVPVFRLLGSDPIAQYDCGMGGHHQPVVTLEPVYGNAGGNDDWCDWFFEKMIYDPAMTLTYFQAGQENMFTWPRMRHGLEYQFPMMARLAEKGDLNLQTLAETGADFLAAHKLTPPSALSALDDFEGKGQKTVWFNSRNYRLNLMWEKDRMFVRDIHLFDENQESLYLKEPCQTDYCMYWTLPVVEGNVWSNDSVRGSLRFYSVGPKGESVEMQFGDPQISNDGKTLSVSVPVTNLGMNMAITMDERRADFELQPVGNGKETVRWYAALEHAPSAELPFSGISPNRIDALYKGYPYSILVENAVAADTRTAPRSSKGVLRALTVTPDARRMSLVFGK